MPMPIADCMTMPAACLKIACPPLSALCAQVTASSWTCAKRAIMCWLCIMMKRWSAPAGISAACVTCRLAELQQLELFKTGEHIPTFDEVLSLVNGQVPLIVELKTDFYNHALPQAVHQRLSQYSGVYCIESFDPFAVRWYRKNARSVVRGQLSFMPPLKDKPFKEKLRRIALGYLLIDFLGRPDFIAYGYKTDANISFRIVANIFRPLLAAWTVCDQETYRELQQYYDIQIFERFRAQ